ncbi:hypothetical protein VC83_06886 [Pseudogymnoascus destructans]|uniref:Cyanovirin-N domain-containing protein n=2 Tax=Pseudogymnoascus destructans TaxID=655981 RepID=L8G206_PSED2|nr:uncharacterized protein VC83_06886 [Pseudogymnoascus destructans]ELR06006.1 hypothetical protein GMDG_07717 [Pseudogymnoascus destructans 20631-21]OAF56786.1 hypothetical protein VC83_06886 [Pseudogymnoascus destructans]
MRLFIPSTAIVAAGFVGQSAAIRTVPSSPCASLCGDVTSTTNSEILCTQADLNTAKGQVFSKCISCQMASTAMDPKTGDTDLKWVLYNLRYAMSSCMWGFPGNSSVQNTPCLTSRACEPFQGNLQYQGLSPNITTYDYCPNTLPSEVIINRCKDCIRQGDQTYLSNYFITILAGCAIQSGAPLPLHKDLFSGDYVNPLDFRSHADSEPTSNSPTELPLQHKRFMPSRCQLGPALSMILPSLQRLQREDRIEFLRQASGMDRRLSRDFLILVPFLVGMVSPARLQQWNSSGLEGF